MVAAAENLLRAGDRIVCLTGIDGSGTIDMVIVLDLGVEVEDVWRLSRRPASARRHARGLRERLLTLASELSLEGREGRPVGTLFVVGDSERVLAQSRQLVMNPFHGLPRRGSGTFSTPRLEDVVMEHRRGGHDNKISTAPQRSLREKVTSTMSALRYQR